MGAPLVVWVLWFPWHSEVSTRPLGASLVSPYIDSAPTLGRLIKDALDISVFQVEKVNLEKRILFYKKISDLKGAYSGVRLRLRVMEDAPRFVLDWAVPGKTLVALIHADVAVLCLGKLWFESARSQGDWWTATRARPELSLAYFGPTQKLWGAIPRILEGKEAVITTVVHGADGLGMYFDVAFKDALRGSRCRIQRIKASLEMPADCWHIGKDPRWFAGLGPAGIQEIPGLVQAFSEIDPEERSDAAWALGLLGKEAEGAVPTLRDVIARETDVFVRIGAAEALAKIDPDAGEGVSRLIRSLGDKNPQVRAAAAEALGNVGPKARAAVPDLIERLEDQDFPVRRIAAGSLGQIGPPAQAAVPALARLLGDTRLREAAAEALGDLGPRAQQAALALQAGLKDPSLRYRWSVLGALVRIGGPAGRAAVPALIEALNNGDSRSYYNATLYLSRLGPDAKEAIPALLGHDDDLSSCAVWSIDPKNGIRGYVKTSLTTDRTCDQWFAASHFEGMGSQRKEAARAVAEAIIDGRLTRVADWVVHLILRGESEAVVQTFVAALKVDEPDRRKRAAQYLGRMGSEAGAARPILSRALEDSHEEVREAASEALRRIEPGPSK